MLLPFEAAIPHCYETVMSAFNVTPEFFLLCTVRVTACSHDKTGEMFSASLVVRLLIDCNSRLHYTQSVTTYNTLVTDSLHRNIPKCWSDVQLPATVATRQQHIRAMQIAEILVAVTNALIDISCSMLSPKSDTLMSTQ